MLILFCSRVSKRDSNSPFLKEEEEEDVSSKNAISSSRRSTSLLRSSSSSSKSISSSSSPSFVVISRAAFSELGKEIFEMESKEIGLYTLNKTVEKNRRKIHSSSHLRNDHHLYHRRTR